MKSIEQRIAEARQHGVDKGVPVAEFSEVFAEVKKNFPNETDEQLAEKRLSATLAVLKKHNLRESSGRVMRRNGSDFGDTHDADQDRIISYMRGSGMNFVEAACMATGEIPKDRQTPAYVKDSIRESWKDYLSTISESDLNTLVERGVWAPKV